MALFFYNQSGGRCILSSLCLMRMSYQRIGVFILFICSFIALSAESIDSITIRLRDVEVKASNAPRDAAATGTAVTVSDDEMLLHMGSSFSSILSHIEGVQSMDIGVGFSKPMIRGLGFQRIAVTENGVKQEGQQWGADHGLEIDAFNVNGVRILKGPASVLYGSDAMGGVLEIQPPVVPRNDTIFGDVTFLYQSVSSGLSGSARMAVKRKRFFVNLRYTERHWADYRVPADSFTYLGMRLPILRRRLKNTAGEERCGNIFLHWRSTNFRGEMTVSDAYQRSGFFSGAHGVPSSTNLADDGRYWNIDLPYSQVNHLKAISRNIRTAGITQTTVTLGYQLNHREEWSTFHTHITKQQPPEKNPNLELLFQLHTASLSAQVRLTPNTTWEHYTGFYCAVST